MAGWISKIAALVPAERVSTRASNLDQASRDESSLPPVRPEAVVWPLSTDEVVGIVGICREHGVALTARGAGTSLEGNPIPVRGGLVVDFSRMTRIVEVRPGDLAVRVEPGVVYDDLNRSLRTHGLFFAPSPGGSSDTATIGGMVANDASGIHAVKYGATRDAVLGLRMVTGTGNVLALGSLAPKSSSGYHLLGLVVGSEGTLGLVTEVTLRLCGLPAERRQLAFAFASERKAAEAIAAMMSYGIDLAAAEFLDRRVLAALNAFRGFGLVERPTVLLEVHGSAKVADEGARLAAEICSEHGAEAIRLPDGRSPWEIRHYATYAVKAEVPDGSILRTDLGFPLSALPDVVAESERLGAEHDVRLRAFGHAGLGILHVLIVERESDAGRWRRALEVKDAIIRFVLARGGTVSGEHGLGLGNREYAPLEHGAAIDLMREIKRAFDPDGILNPGKIWP